MVPPVEGEAGDDADNAAGAGVSVDCGGPSNTSAALSLAAGVRLREVRSLHASFLTRHLASPSTLTYQSSPATLIAVARSDPDPSVRDGYARLGVDAYYRRHAATYRNPHEDALRAAIDRAVAAWALDLSTVLDLAAGSGEVTLTLRELGAGRIDAVDPFTAEAYSARTGAACEPLDFAAIASGAFAGRRYSLIVCSFAMHLCEPSRLPGLALQLASVAPRLLILTPHKRPVIRPEWGWALLDELVVQRVRARCYRRRSEDAHPAGQCV